MLVKNYGKNLLYRKTITSYETKSFVDIQLKTDTIKKLSTDSSTGLNAASTYTTVLVIAGTTRTISVSGNGITTVAGLVNSLNTALGVAGTATFLGAVSGSTEQVIRIQTAGASDTLTISSSGSLISSLVGDKFIGIKASYGTPVVNGGYNFVISNAASVSNPIDIGFFAQATTALGVDIAISRIYNRTTGEVTVKKSSGSFSATDVITVYCNILG